MNVKQHPRLPRVAGLILLTFLGCRHWAPNRHAAFYHGHERGPVITHLDRSAENISAGLHMEFDDLKARFTHQPSDGYAPSLYDAVATYPAHAPLPVVGPAGPLPHPGPEPLPFDPAVGMNPGQPRAAHEHRPWYARLRPRFGWGRGPTRTAKNDVPSVLAKD